MITKKDLIIVVLATFCLTATLFTVVPTKSQDDRYDPWLDVNDDGTINILDLTQAAIAFGSSGDPTKDVKILHSTNEWIQNFTQPPHSTEYYWEPTKGYKKITLYVFVREPVTPDCQVEVSTNFWIEGSDYAPNMDGFVVNRFWNASVWKTYEIIGSTFGFGILNPTSTEINGTIAVYVTT